MHIMIQGTVEGERTCASVVYHICKMYGFEEILPTTTDDAFINIIRPCDAAFPSSDTRALCAVSLMKIK